MELVMESRPHKGGEQLAETPSPQELQEERESFGLQVSGGAHHLNNIFAQVLLNAELVERNRLDDSAIRMLDSIVDGVHAAIKVVDLLASQATARHGKKGAVDLKYLVKGLQKRRDVYFTESVVVNAQYPPRIRLAWAKPAPLLRGVLQMCRLTAETAPERQTLFVQVEDVDGDDGNDGVAIDIAAPAPMVAAGLAAGEPPAGTLLDPIIEAVTDSGGIVEIIVSVTGGTMVRFRFQTPPEE